MPIFKFFFNSHYVIQGSTPMITKGIQAPHKTEIKYCFKC